MNTISDIYLIYIDESYDDTHFVYSAVFVPVTQWNSIFNKVFMWRQDLYVTHSIDTQHELHSTDFIAGRGQPNNNRDKLYRANLFNSFFKFFDSLEGVFVINGITTNKQKHEKLFEWILNRVNRTLANKNCYGIFICDEGNEKKLISMVRKMKKKQ
jgi:hypothetical protein